MNSLFKTIQHWYENGFYYPDVFVCTLGTLGIILGIVLVKTISGIGTKRWKRVCSYLSKNPVPVFIILLIIAVFSRFSVTFFTDYRALTIPEAKRAYHQIGWDWYMGVIRPAYRFLDKKSFEIQEENYGPAFAVIIAPFVSLAEGNGLCDRNNRYSCSHIFYTGLVASIFVGYVWFIWRILKKQKEDACASLLFLLIFILGPPGSKGIEGGNVDILYSLMFGVIMALLLQKKRSLFISVIIGIALGFLSNSKFFLIPLSLGLMYISGSMGITFLSFLVSYVGLTLCVGFYGVSYTLKNTVEASFAFYESVAGDPNGMCFPCTHSFSMIATHVADCLRTERCKTPQALRMIWVTSTVFFIGVFIAPCVASIKRTWKRYGSLWSYVVFLWRGRERMMFLMYAFFNAGMNLIPEFSHDYRLYYSLPLCFVLLAATGDQTIRMLTYGAMVMLSIKSLWIATDIIPTGLFPLDVRVMNIVLLIHYYMLIRAGIRYAFELPAKKTVRNI